MVLSIPIKYKWFFNRSIWLIDGTWTNITTLSKSEPRSNGNGEVLHTPQISKKETSRLNAV